MSDKQNPAEAATRENGDWHSGAICVDDKTGKMEIQLWSDKEGITIATFHGPNARANAAFCAALSTHQQQGAESELVKRVRELAALQTTYSEKLAKTNAAIPALEASQGERDAYQLLYRASHEAHRAVQSAALKLAYESPTLCDALSRAPQPDTVTEAARDLVALWKSPTIAGLPRSERNAAIEDSRNRLIAAVDAAALAARGKA